MERAVKVVKSYTQGIKRATSEGKMLLLLWLFNILFASVIYFQFSDYLHKAIGTSAAAANFLKTIDFNSLFEMSAFNGAALGAIISLAMYLSLVYGFFSIFLSGGILQTLFAGGSRDATGDKRRMASLFFQGAGKFFGRFFRLFLYSLVLWAGMAVIMVIFAMIIGPVTRNSTNEALMFYLGLTAGIVGLFLVFLIMMIVDYARIKIVVENSSAVLRSLLQSIGFVFRRFGKTLALYYFYLLTGAAIIAVYWAIASGIRTHSLLPILVAFLAGQMFIFLRGWIKVSLQAAQMDFFRSGRPPAPEATPERAEEAPEQEPHPA